jgi:peptidyl-prolyl cis-trans isomerase SurA
MRLKIIISFAVLLLCLNVNLTIAQTKSADYSTEVVAEVGNEKITAQDLMNAYQKNLSRKHENLFASPKDSIYEFLNLFINFRLKVNDALGRSYDKDSSVISETKQNRKILAESFYYEKKLSEPYVDFLVKQREKEYLVAIMLFPLQYNAATQIPDTTESYKKLRVPLPKLKMELTLLKQQKLCQKIRKHLNAVV